MTISKPIATAALLLVSFTPRVDSFQSSQSKQPVQTLKLSYAREDLLESYPDIPIIAPISLSANGWLVPVGDMLYMVDSRNRVVWEFSVEPNFIFDVAVDSKGMIYVAVFDGLLIALNDAGENVWSKFMNGSANYTQLEPYRGGVLAVLSMEAYRRTKGLDCEDTLVFWKNKEEVWRKDFPRNAHLNVLGGHILAVKTTKDGKEMTLVP